MMSGACASGAVADPAPAGLRPLHGIQPHTQVRPVRSQPFDDQTVARQAKALARTPYLAPATDLPSALGRISYDAYRAIRNRPDRALWQNDGLPFKVEFFHRGFSFRERVDLFQVDGGQVRPILYDPGRFESDKLSLAGLPPDLGYAGFRLHAPLNRPDYFDEIAVFLGASYFRSLGRNEVYGLSARGLALNTTGPGPEEFPRFVAFWIERPAPGATAVVVHGLLDGPSVAGAYRFVITPGEHTNFEVRTQLFPRVALTGVGVAPMTSMFLFGPASSRRFDDYRRAVHDSDGLQIWNGAGEGLWRPLVNPADVEESAFRDTGPKGFGLIQRDRRLADYEDLEARYDERPSLWAEIMGDWGPGAVHLIELPTALERQDNIVAFWRPQSPLPAGSEQRFDYRLSWGPPPALAPGLARVAATRTGAAAIQTRIADDPPDPTRIFSVDFEFVSPGTRPGELSAKLWSSAGKLSPPVLTPLDDGSAVRLDFQLDPGAAHAAELRAELTRDLETVSETWLYRWTA
jgi:glucans biosynthesis protein